VISPEFLLTALIVVLMPGTGVFYTVSTGLTRGKGASFYAAFGCTLGILPHLLATVGGLAAVMHTSALAFQILKYAGAIYLLYMAVTTWRDTAAFSLGNRTPEVSPPAIVVKAFLLNILNPKLTLFFLAFLPQFIPVNTRQPVLQMMFLSTVFMGMTFAVFVVYGVAADIFRRRVVGSFAVQRWLRCSFAGLFAGLGIKLALTDRN
jgi:threonine/homoserine/homoserine lactone efflux protein